MTVARILTEKGRDVLTTQPHRTIKEVAALARAPGASAPSSCRTRRCAVLGIVSERDIVRAIGTGAVERAGRAGFAPHDGESDHRDRERLDRPGHGADDRRALPPSARGRERAARRHRFDRRRRQAPRQRDRQRAPRPARIYRHAPEALPGCASSRSGGVGLCRSHRSARRFRRAPRARLRGRAR